MEIEKSGIYLYADTIKLSKEKRKIPLDINGKLLTPEEYRNLVFTKDPRAENALEK